MTVMARLTRPLSTVPPARADRMAPDTGIRECLILSRESNINTGSASSREGWPQSLPIGLMAPFNQPC